MVGTTSHVHEEHGLLEAHAHGHDGESVTASSPNNTRPQSLHEVPVHAPAAEGGEEEESVRRESDKTTRAWGLRGSRGFAAGAGSAGLKGLWIMRCLVRPARSLDCAWLTAPTLHSRSRSGSSTTLARSWCTRSSTRSSFVLAPSPTRHRICGYGHSLLRTPVRGSAGACTRMGRPVVPLQRAHARMHAPAPVCPACRAVHCALGDDHRQDVCSDWVRSCLLNQPRPMPRRLAPSPALLCPSPRRALPRRLAPSPASLCPSPRRALPRLAPHVFMSWIVWRMLQVYRRARHVWRLCGVVQPHHRHSVHYGGLVRFPARPASALVREGAGQPVPLLSVAWPLHSALTRRRFFK